MATSPRSLSVSSVAAIAALLLSRGVRADDLAPVPAASPDPAATAAEPAATRRSSFVLGLNAGLGAMSIVGYPNDVKKIGYAHWYTATGARPAFLGEAWVGAALTDWFTFALGGTVSLETGTGDEKARSVGGMFHIDAYPLFSLGGHWRDLGVRFDAGLGVATVKDKGGDALVDSSAASLIGGGVFYEGIRLWRVGQGPFLMGNYLWSDTARRPALFLGWRANFATGP